MLLINPFADLATIIPAFLMQYFVIAMVLLIIVGTIIKSTIAMTKYCIKKAGITVARSAKGFIDNINDS